MNVTMISLSLANTYSIAPLFLGNKMTISNSFFMNFIPTILFNPEIFYLNKCTFNKGQGSIIAMDEIISFYPFSKIQLNADDNKPNEINNTQINKQNELNSYPAYIIRDCTFTNIAHSTDNYGCLKVYGGYPFYMTNCLFHSITDKQATILLTVSASTITHICMYECYSGEQYDFIHLNIGGNSFAIVLYSTFYNAKDNYKPKSCEFQSGYQKLKCLNFTQLKNDAFCMKMNDPLCLMMLFRISLG